MGRLDKLCSTPRQGSSAADCHGIVLSGPAGIGKTTLVSRWLETHPEAFPDGRVYADLHGHSPDGSARPEDVLDRFILEFGVLPAPLTLTEKRLLWHSMTEGLRLVVVLDNALDTDQVRMLLPSSTGSLTVVTSRRRMTELAKDGIASYDLGTLDTVTAVEAFQHGLGRNGRRKVARERLAVRQIMSSCAGIPLKVCLASALVAASASRRPVAAVAAALAREDEPQDWRQGEGDSSLRGLLDEACRRLPDDITRAYRLLSVLPANEFDEPAVAAVCAVSPQRATEILDALVEMHLVEESARGCYRIHSLVLPYVRQQAERQENVTVRRKAVRRFLDFCLATLSAAEVLLCPGRKILRRDYETFTPGPPPFADGDGALDWLKDRSGWLMAALRAAADGGWYQTAWQMADAMWPMFLRLRPHLLWIESHEIGLAAARLAGDQDGIVRMLTSGGIGLQNAGHLDEATEWFADALASARKRHNKWDQAQALHGIGQSHWLANRFGPAEDSLTEALALRDDLGYRRGKALTRIILGDISRATGRIDEALGLLARAHADLLAEGDRHDAARAAAFLGLAYADSGDIEAAQRYLLVARHTFAIVRSVLWEARALEMLGQVKEHHGGTESARRWYEHSLQLYKGSSPRDAKRLENRIGELGKLSGGGSGSTAGG